MDWEFAFKAISAINILATGVMAFVMWMRKPGEDAGKSIDSLKGEVSSMMNAQSERISRIEEQLKHIPTNDELQRLDGSLREANARIESIGHGQQRLLNQMDLIQRFLMEKKQ
jgi:predicted  nucleic acid-binding Zn-ribbon protein